MPDRAQGTTPIEPTQGAGGRLVSVDGRTLPLRAVRLWADAKGGLARVVLEQDFVNPYAETLHVSYLVPLPVEAALSGYAIRIGERRIKGQIEDIGAARARYEEALLEGRSAGLVEQDRANLFTLELGNLPPGVTVLAELTLDQKLTWLDEGAWEWRFPLVVAPRYLGAEGRVSDAERITVDVAEAGLVARAELTLLIRDAIAGDGTPASPSHLIVTAPAALAHRVTLAEGPAALDRDLVVRWPVAGESPSLSLDVARSAEGHALANEAYGLLTVVPPGPRHHPGILKRDLILLIDTSGSMAGWPSVQAKTVARVLVESLEDTDQLEMIAFSDRPRRWRSRPVPVTAAVRRDALAWLDALTTGGGTEMLDAVVSALAPLRSNAQRQTILITDGLVGFEKEIVGHIRRTLPAGSRVHTVGIGSAVNRTLTAGAARAGGGAEIVLGLDEDSEPSVSRLLARTAAPLLTSIRISGSAHDHHVPAAVPDVHAGAPLRVGVRLAPGGGELIVRGQTPAGEWEERLTVPAIAAGHGNPAVIALYGRERVEDFEARHSAGDPSDVQIRRIGLDFQIATRLTSWVAIAEEPAVDPRASVRRKRIPHALPHGLSIEGLGLRPRLGGSLSAEEIQSIKSLVRGAVTTWGLEASPPLASLQLTLRSRDADERPAFEPSARLIAGRGRMLTFEIRIAEISDWDPTWFVAVGWPRHPISECVSVKAETIRRGSEKVGNVIRLVVSLGDDPPDDSPTFINVILASRHSFMIPVHRA